MRYTVTIKIKLTNLRFLTGIVAALCFTLYGCGGGNSVIIWSATSKSPDGQWIAEAHTAQSSGLGTAAVATGVYIKQAVAHSEKIQILGFSNASAYPIGVTSVKMRWMTNSHLDVTYGKGAQLSFQVIKAYGLEFTAHQSE